MSKLQQNIPKLRFPEFSEEWGIKELGDITEKMQSGLSRKLSDSDIGLPVIRSNNIKNQSIDISNLSYWYIKDPQGADTENYILNNYDLLINFINSPSQIGKFALYKGELDRKTIFTTNIMRLTFINKVSPIFIALSLDSKRYFDYIQSITKPAVNQASFTTIDLKKYKIYLPNLIEQQKIANFLTAVDDKISALDKKVSTLKHYKKGVMQKIFSQQIRFKDENGDFYPDWEEKKLQEIGEIITGKTPKTNNKTLWGGDVPFVTPSDIDNSLKYQLTTNRLINGDNIKLIPPSSIYYTCIASIGKMSMSTQPSVTNQQINTLIPYKKYNNEYVYYALLDISPKIKNTQSNTTLPIINKTEFSKFRIPSPTIVEQQKIANFLTAIDQKITAEESKLKTAKEWKKGLLQRMFV